MTRENKNSPVFGFEALAGQIQKEMDSITEVRSTPIQPVNANTAVTERKSISMIKRAGVQNVKGLALESLLDELVKPVVYAINKEKINSFNVSVLGDLALALNRAPRGLKLVHYGWCDQSFYIIKNAARESLVYDIVKEAALQSADDTFRLPFVGVRKITIDPNYGGKDAPDIVKPCELEVKSLTFTDEEIGYLEFAFIENIELEYDPNSDDPYKDAYYVFTVDKRLIQVAPFERGES